MPYCRYFKIAGIPIQVKSDIPMSEKTFCAKLASFEIKQPEENMVHIEHHFGLPNINVEELGKKVFERQGFSAYQRPDIWTYFINDYDLKSKPVHQVAFVNPSHTRMKFFNDRKDLFKEGDIPFLSFYLTDQLFISRVLADRHGCMFHSSGVIIEGKGLLFAGHSGAGKSTIGKMLDGQVEILCDDRIIVRKDLNGFRIHGTYYHGEIPVFSPHSAPLKALFFLEKSNHNRLIPIPNKTELISRLIAYGIKTIKPLTTADWWQKTLDLINDLVSEIPCQKLKFDKSGEVLQLLKEI